MNLEAISEHIILMAGACPSSPSWCIFCAHWICPWCAHVTCSSWLCHCCIHVIFPTGGENWRTSKNGLPTTVHWLLFWMWKFPLGVISKHLFNAGNQLYIFNQLPTAKESATLWYPFPGKRLQSCPIMFVCACLHSVYPQTTCSQFVGSSVKKWPDLQPTYILLPVCYYSLTSISHISYICSKGRCDLLSSWLTSCWCSISWSLVTTQEKQWKSSHLRTTCFQTTNMQPTRFA